MGDIADMLADQAMDAWLDGRYDGDDYYAFHAFRNPPKIFSCDRCGKFRLHWGEHHMGGRNNHWLPTEEDGTLHRCRATDEFEDLGP